MMAMLCWRFIAFLAIKMAAVGVVVPGVPTVPFILLAAWSAGKGWPQLERWLLQHEKYGPLILAWRHERAIPRSAKWLATAMMLFSVVTLLVSPAPIVPKVILPIFLVVVAAWLWTRREPGLPS
ncbi:MAG: YbaN family protein [Gammaproteobacteria bacterium]|nr:YbaN family protein [Gammaproteobacteria bacterium]